MNPLLWAMLLSIAPVSELRGGIPYLAYNNFSPFFAFAVCVLINFLVVPIFFFFLEFIHHRLLHIRAYKMTFDHFLEKARRKTHKKIEKYGYLGLAIFVAIPLPVTGAWTGTLAAWFFGMEKKKAFLSIALGVIIAGIIVTLVSYLGIGALRIFIK